MATDKPFTATDADEYAQWLSDRMIGVIAQAARLAATLREYAAWKRRCEHATEWFNKVNEPATDAEIAMFKGMERCTNAQCEHCNDKLRLIVRLEEAERLVHVHRAQLSQWQLEGRRLTDELERALAKSNNESLRDAAELRILWRFGEDSEGNDVAPDLRAIDARPATWHIVKRIQMLRDEVLKAREERDRLCDELTEERVRSTNLSSDASWLRSEHSTLVSRLFRLNAEVDLWRGRYEAVAGAWRDLNHEDGASCREKEHVYDVPRQPQQTCRCGKERRTIQEDACRTVVTTVHDVPQEPREMRPDSETRGVDGETATTIFGRVRPWRPCGAIMPPETGVIGRQNQPDSKSGCDTWHNFAKPKPEQKTMACDCGLYQTRIEWNGDDTYTVLGVEPALFRLKVGKVDPWNRRGDAIAYTLEERWAVGFDYNRKPPRAWIERWNASPKPHDARVVPAKVLEDLLTIINAERPMTSIREAARAAERIVGPTMPCCNGYAWQHRKVSLVDESEPTVVLCPITMKYERATAEYLGWSEAQR